MREHCLTQLNKALEENSRVCTSHSLSPAVSLGKLEAAAVGMEYSVFLGVKSVQVYKLTVHKKVLERACTCAESWVRIPPRAALLKRVVLGVVDLFALPRDFVDVYIYYY